MILDSDLHKDPEAATVKYANKNIKISHDNSKTSH